MKGIIKVLTALCIPVVIIAVGVSIIKNMGLAFVIPNDTYYPPEASVADWLLIRPYNYDKVISDILSDTYVKFMEGDSSSLMTLGDLGYTCTEPGVIKDGSNFLTIPIVDESNVSIKIINNVPEGLSNLNEGRHNGIMGKLEDTGEGIEITGYEDSNYIDVEKLSSYIVLAASQLKDTNTIQVNLEDYYTATQLTNEYDDTIEELDKYNSFLIKYSNGFELNSQVLYNRGLVYIDNNKIKVNITDEDCRSICARNLTGYNTIGSDFTFVTHDGKEKTVTSVTYGDYIDYQSEAEYLVDAISNMKSEDGRVPIMKQESKFKLDETCIEVSIDEQHAYYYKDGELVLDFDVVTGKPTAERETHKGIYFIYNKAKDDVHLAKYDVTVQRWLSVTYDGQGFHDASWRSAFGGDIYKTNGSHGCINSPKDKIYELYDMVEIGTPVVIY